MQQAEHAAAAGEVPVGAVLIGEDLAGKQRLLAAAHNAPITSHDPTGHAEVRVLRQAAAQLENYRLVDTTLYVTLEPCMMCVGAIVHARIARLVYGATEPKAGAVVSHPLLDADWLNHRVQVTGGVLAPACGQLLSDFFTARRAAGSVQ